MSILNNLGFEYTVTRKSKRKGSKKANPFLLLLMAVIFNYSCHSVSCSLL